MADIERKCGNCEWFKSHGKTGPWGDCKIFPPKYLANNNFGCFPKVEDCDFCGEFKPKVKFIGNYAGKDIYSSSFKEASPLTTKVKIGERYYRYNPYDDAYYPTAAELRVQAEKEKTEAEVRAHENSEIQKLKAKWDQRETWQKSAEQAFLRDLIKDLEIEKEKAKEKAKAKVERKRKALAEKIRRDERTRIYKKIKSFILPEEDFQKDDRGIKLIKNNVLMLLCNTIKEIGINNG